MLDATVLLVESVSRSIDWYCWYSNLCCCAAIIILRENFRGDVIARVFPLTAFAMPCHVSCCALIDL